MMLSDGGILRAMGSGQIWVEKFDQRLLQPASIDVRLSAKYLWPTGGMTSRDNQMNVNYAEGEITPKGELMLRPGDFFLGSTQEKIALGSQMAARVEGKSSLGRLGLQVHLTAGFIDPGFRGDVTLELKNAGPFTIALWPGMPIAQLCFFSLDRPVNRPYGHPELGSKYQNQSGPTSAR